MTLYYVFAGLFVAPFIDVRRPFQMRHLDLLVIAGFGLHAVNLLEHGPVRVNLRAAFLIAAAGLAYLLVRASLLGLRRTASTTVRVTRIPVRWLLVATIVLTGVRLGLPLVDDRGIIDVGGSSVLGAEHILEGSDLYGAEGYRYPERHPDTYGPVNYLLYVPFAWAFDSQAYAARAATNLFDLLTLVALFALGRRLGGSRGRETGVVLAYAWAAFPITLFCSLWAYNDMLVPLFALLALLAVASPARSGLILGLGAAAKFVPVVIAPLYVRATHERTRLWTLLGFGAAFAFPVVAASALLLPDGGVNELLDRTVGWQLTRRSPGSIWAQFDVIEPLRYVVLVGAVLFAAAVAVVPARRSLFQLAALSGAVVIAFELALRHWLPSYTLWFAPFFFVAILAPQEDVPARAQDEDAGLSDTPG